MNAEDSDNPDHERPPSDKTAQTLSLLQEHIARQRSLFERTSADIKRLQDLRRHVADNPVAVMDRLVNREYYRRESLDNDGMDVDNDSNINLDLFEFGKLSELVEEVRATDLRQGPIQDIDWSFFRGRDPSTLRDLATTSRQAHLTTVIPPPSLAPLPPHHTPHTCPSMSKKSSHTSLSSFLPPIKPLTGKETDLQLLVRTQRALIIEPAIRKAEEFLATFPPDSDCERESKKESSKRRRTGLGLIRPRGPSGVFVRKDVDESADVEVADVHHHNHNVCGSNGTSGGNNAKRRKSSVASSIYEADSPCLAHNKPKRTRKPSTRLLSVFDNGTTNHNASQDDDASSNHDTRRSASVPSAPPAPAALPRLTIRIPARLHKPSTTVSESQPSSSRVQQTPTTPSTNANGVYDDDDDDMQSIRCKSESPSTPYDEENSVNNHTPTPTHTHPKHQHRPRRRHHTQEEDDGDEGESEIDHDFKPQRRSVPGNKQAREEKKKVETGGIGGKPKAATFNIPWSTSEQHLLEKLLEEIPQGETNRWVKISTAMEGRRTARQVASRVQKYFEKLKKFGVE